MEKPTAEDIPVLAALEEIRKMGFSNLQLLSVGATCLRWALVNLKEYNRRRVMEDPDKEDARILDELGLLRNWYRYEDNLISEVGLPIFLDTLERLAKWCRGHGYTLWLDGRVYELPGMSLRIGLVKKK